MSNAGVGICETDLQKLHVGPGNKVYCDREHTKEEVLKRIYPQGWSHYPGDTCKHGVYVGGIGVDHMCQKCEDGQ